jgi:hypothetical protein
LKTISAESEKFQNGRGVCRTGAHRFGSHLQLFTEKDTKTLNKLFTTKSPFRAFNFLL